MDMGRRLQRLLEKLKVCSFIQCKTLISKCKSLTMVIRRTPEESLMQKMLHCHCHQAHKFAQSDK